MSMFRWLNGPGAPLRRPLPGSTNYLNAYDRDGTLLRASHQDQPEIVPTDDVAKNEEKDKDEGADEDKKEKNEDDEGDGNEERAPPQVKGPRHVRPAAPAKFPPERPQDLRPFPMNPQFTSQSVLDEALRDEIYNRVQLQGKSVRTVSAELSVAMDRVAAVARLKAVEKEWTKKVRNSGPLYICPSST